MARRARLIIMGSIKALLRPILGRTPGVILGILGFILGVLGGAQSALDYINCIVIILMQYLVQVQVQVQVLGGAIIITTK